MILPMFTATTCIIERQVTDTEYKYYLVKVIKEIGFKEPNRVFPFSFHLFNL